MPIKRNVVSDVNYGKVTGLSFHLPRHSFFPLSQDLEYSKKKTPNGRENLKRLRKAHPFNIWDESKSFRPKISLFSPSFSGEG